MRQQKVLTTNNAETYWDNTTSQQYGEYEKDNCSYKIWVENADSIAAKVQLAVKYRSGRCFCLEAGL